MADVLYRGNASSVTARIDAEISVMTWHGFFGVTAWNPEDKVTYLLAQGCTSSVCTATTMLVSTSRSPVAPISTMLRRATFSACGVSSTAWP